MGGQIMVSPLRLTLLGGLHLTLGEAPLTGFVSSKVQALLCFLAVTGRSCTRSELAGLLWADMAESQAASNLRKALSNLNQIAGPHLTITRQAAAFNRDSPHWLDVEQFESCLDAGRPASDPERWREADALYRGDFLQGFYVHGSPDFEQWMLLERERLRRLAISNQHRLSGYCAARRDYAAALEYTRRLLALEPWSEEAHRQLMHLLAQSGQRSAALAQYAVCRRVLQEELGVEPTHETMALYERIREAAGAPPHNLPAPPMPIVGRAQELNEIARLFGRSDCRLLTLVGLSGIGKSRLALDAARAQLGAFLHGVFWVSLAPLRSVEYLVPAIAEAVGAPLYPDEAPANQLLQYLAEKQMLLVLDSFEHVLDGAGLLAEILAQAPGIKLLATTTERLKLQGEWLLPVGGLSLPPPQPDMALEAYSAVELFLQRAQRLGRPTAESEMRCVARICRLVEGMPLAIELAAAWARVALACDIAPEIERNRDFLATTLRDVPARHRSMRAVFDYGWDVLSPGERDAFSRLAVFRRGFERSAGEWVADAALPTLAALVDKSLLTCGAAGRYQAHDLLRQFAEEKLEQQHLAAHIRSRHLDYYLHLAEEADSQLHGPEQLRWLDRLEAEHDNLRAALEWALGAGDLPASALRLAGSLGLFWDLRGHFSEGRRWLDQVLGLEAPPAPGRLGEAGRSQALYWAGHLAKWQGDYRRAAELAVANLELCRSLGDQWRLAYALYLSGSVANKQGDLRGAKAYLDESLLLFRQVKGRWGLAHTLGTLGNIAKALGDFDGASQYWQESYALYQAIGDRRGLARTLNRMWRLPYEQGDYALAETLLGEAEALFRELKHRDGVAIILRHLGLVAQAQGDGVRARLLLEESRAIFQALADNDDLVYAMWYLGRLELSEGQFDLAQTVLEQAHSLAQAVGNAALTSCVTQSLASAARQRADYQTARRHLQESLALARESEEREVLAEALLECGLLHAAQGNFERMAQAFGAAEALHAAHGAWPPVDGRAEYERHVALARSQLGEAAFTAAWQVGQATSLDPTVSYQAVC
jgi:predicted ATPase/DNA-binding SARP family transcriptional activator